MTTIATVPMFAPATQALARTDEPTHEHLASHAPPAQRVHQCTALITTTILQPPISKRTIEHRDGAKKRAIRKKRNGRNNARPVLPAPRPIKPSNAAIASNSSALRRAEDDTGTTVRIASTRVTSISSVRATGKLNAGH
ncbi:MAG TPA: hypothetical protein VNZ58_06145 [Thermomicrobiales bacterium]|nr:hypothetical protein [Thermomicrobiales bacterium]